MRRTGKKEKKKELKLARRDGQRGKVAETEIYWKLSKGGRKE